MTPVLQKAGFDEIFPVLIFFGVIIAQIIKAARKIPKGRLGLPPLPGPEQEPRDELRKFLESLAGGRPLPEAKSAPPPRPRVPPPPPARRVAPVARPVAAVRPPVVSAPAKPTMPAIVVAETARQELRGPARRVRGAAAPRNVVHSDLRDLREQLSDRGSLARAFILKEILDAPLSLRSRS